MKDAVESESFYHYEDAARAAIESFAYDVALPEPTSAQAEPAAEASAAPEAGAGQSGRATALRRTNALE